MASVPQILEIKWPGCVQSCAQQPDGSYLIVMWDAGNPQPQPTEDEVLAFSDEVDGILRRRGMVLTPIQFRRGLSAIGKRAAAEAIVAGADEEVQDFYQYATVVERLNPFIEQFRQHPDIALTAEEVDDFFETYAATTA